MQGVSTSLDGGRCRPVGRASLHFQYIGTMRAFKCQLSPSLTRTRAKCFIHRPIARLPPFLAAGFLARCPQYWLKGEVLFPDA